MTAEEKKAEALKIVSEMRKDVAGLSRLQALLRDIFSEQEAAQSKDKEIEELKQEAIGNAEVTADHVNQLCELYKELYIQNSANKELVKEIEELKVSLEEMEIIALHNRNEVIALQEKFDRTVASWKKEEELWKEQEKEMFNKLADLKARQPQTLSEERVLEILFEASLNYRSVEMIEKAAKAICQLSAQPQALDLDNAVANFAKHIKELSPGEIEERLSKYDLSIYGKPPQTLSVEVGVINQHLEFSLAQIKDLQEYNAQKHKDIFVKKNLTDLDFKISDTLKLFRSIISAQPALPSDEEIAKNCPEDCMPEWIMGAKWMRSLAQGEGKPKEDGGEQLPDFQDVIEARIKHFNSNYHTHEGSELQNALNIIRRLVPPIQFKTVESKTSNPKPTEDQ